MIEALVIASAVAFTSEDRRDLAALCRQTPDLSRLEDCAYNALVLAAFAARHCGADVRRSVIVLARHRLAATTYPDGKPREDATHRAIVRAANTLAATANVPALCATVVPLVDK